MTIFNSYVSLPEGTSLIKNSPTWISWISWNAKPLNSQVLAGLQRRPPYFFLGGATEKKNFIIQYDHMYYCIIYIDLFNDV